MNTDRIPAVKQNYTALLRAGIAAGVVYQRDLNEAKDYLRRALEAEWEATVTAQTAACPAFWERIRVSEVPTLYPELHRLSTTVRRVFDRTAVRADSDEEFAAWNALGAVLTEWEEIAALVKEATAFKTTARKPSTTPRITPERTYDNTGTCPVCGGNFKLNGAQKMVDHGFKLDTQYGGPRQGHCIGVNYLPWELSTAGAERYVCALKAHLTGTEKLLAGADDLQVVPTYRKTPTKRGDASWEMDLRAYKANLESDIRYTQRTIADFEKRIAEWAGPYPLPGDLLGK
jgi:hypothetical protein